MKDENPYRGLLSDSAQRAVRYLEHIGERPVVPTQAALDNLHQLGGALPESPEDPNSVMKLLDEIGSPATVATTGGRYFGFVVGGALPATVAAHWIADAWDQNACQQDLSPVAAYLEEVVLEWLLELFDLPQDSGGAFVTGAQMANFTCLAAARHAVLKKAGWDVESDGLTGAPPITVVVGEEIHVTVLKALSLLGLGRNRVLTVPTDILGRLKAEALPALRGPSIICTQVGNVNTGSCDPVAEVCNAARQSDAWVHVDGAFGLWAAASPRRKHLVKGVANADSWATDAHKWLNVPQDSGIAMVRQPEHLEAAMTITAAYLAPGRRREPMQWGPESSRRARGIEIWAAMRSLGRQGIADLIDRTCAHASLFAERLRAAGFEILNDVVMNQVLVAFGDAETTQRIISGVQKDGTCWCGGTVWHGRPAMRVSVASWATRESDVERSVSAILKIAGSFKD